MVRDEEKELLKATICGLRTQNRLLAGTLVCVCALVAVGWKGVREDTLRVKKLELVNDEGKVMGELEASSTGAYALLRDATNRPRIVLGTADPKAVALGVNNADGSPGISMVSLRNGGNGLSVFDGKSKATVVLKINNSLPGVVLADRHGTTRSNWTIDSAGAALSLNSSSGKPLASLFGSDQVAGLSILRNGETVGAFANAMGSPQIWAMTQNGSKRDLLLHK